MTEIIKLLNDILAAHRKQNLLCEYGKKQREVFLISKKSKVDRTFVSSDQNCMLSVS